MDVGALLRQCAQNCTRGGNDIGAIEAILPELANSDTDWSKSRDFTVPWFPPASNGFPD